MSTPSGLLARRYWTAHLLVVLAIAGCAAGSDWQFHVWNANRQAAQRSLTDETPVPLRSVLGVGQAFPGSAIGRPVTVSGTWLPGSTFYVSDQPSPRAAARLGYWVVTNVRIAGGAIPVLRGWAPTRRAGPVAGPVALRGWLEPSDESDPVQTASKPPTYGSLSIAALTQTVAEPLIDGYLAVGDGSPGSDRLMSTGPTVTAGVSGSTGLLNFLYGIQWILFALLSVYLWWRWCHGWADERATQDD